VESILELLVLVVAMWPVLRLCASRAFLRKLRAFPGVAAALTRLLALYGFLIVYLALYSPTYLRLIAILAFCALIYERWRARPRLRPLARPAARPANNRPTQSMA